MPKVGFYLATYQIPDAARSAPCTEWTYRSYEKRIGGRTSLGKDSSHCVKFCWIANFCPWSMTFKVSQVAVGKASSSISVAYKPLLAVSVRMGDTCSLSITSFMLDEIHLSAQSCTGLTYVLEAVARITARIWSWSLIASSRRFI